MKKFLLFALVAMIGMPVLAQDEIGDDVTKYIANAGFDEDLTFQKAHVDRAEALVRRDFNHPKNWT